MKKEYSLIDLRFIELRRFYLFKIIFIISLLVIVLSSFLIFLFLPIYYNVPYKDFVYENASFYYLNEHRVMISIIIIAICILLVILISVIVISIINRKYIKMYESILFNELGLEDIKVSFQRNLHHKKIISQHLNFIDTNNYDSEYLFNIEYKEKLSFYNLRKKGINKDENLLVIAKLPTSIKGYIHVSDKLLNKHDYENEDIIEYHYINNKVFDNYVINSTLGKKTNKLCEGGLIHLVEEIRKYCQCNISFVTSTVSAYTVIGNNITIRIRQQIIFFIFILLISFV